MAACGACATASKVADTTPDIPQATATPGCIVLPAVIPGFCIIDGTPLLSGPIKKICQFHDPDRWVLYQPDGETITVIGGKCWTALKGSL